MEKERFEKNVEEATKELLRLSPLHKKAQAELLELDKEITYWAKMKYNAKARLVKVQKVPACLTGLQKKKVKVKKDPTVVELLTKLKNVSSFDKERLLDALSL